MNEEFPFHLLFTLYAFLMVSCRSYYTGYVEASGEAVARLEEGVGLRRLRYALGIPFLLGCLLYILEPRWMLWSQCPLPLGLRWIGVLLLLISWVLYRWTHHHLDKNFTDTVYVRKQSFLVLSGPYRWVRHPMYICGLLAALGTGLTAANWFLGLVGLVLMLIIMIWRTPIEEKKLLERHGKAYQDYKDITGRFFPKFRRLRH